MRQTFDMRGWFKRSGWPLASLGLLAVLTSAVAFSGQGAFDAFKYERSAVLAGEAWRLLSGQLSHLGLSHLFLNLTGVCLLAALYPGVRAGDWWAWFAASAIGVAIGLVVFATEIGWYVGLSGLLHGMLAAAALAHMLPSAQDLPRREQYFSTLVFVIVAGKIGWELYAGALPLTAEISGGAVITEAHFFGFAAGSVWVLGRELLRAPARPRD